LIVLMDKRFTMPAYTQTMPKDWFDSSVSELVSSSILTDITQFWQAKGDIGTNRLQLIG
jgi:DNA excision repair protein ERCC-2